MKMKDNHHNKIYLFDDSVTGNQQNSLKEFIYFLKYTGKRGIINFSYAAANESLHPSLSIKENFILDSVPTSLIKDKEDNLNQTINQLHNKSLIDLIEMINCINRKSSELTLSEKKLCSIVKTLLANSDFIFLELPEQYLDSSTLKKVKECLVYEVENHKRTVFIKAVNQYSWLDIATDIVSKNQYKQYIQSKNPLLSFSSPVIKLERKVEKPKSTNIYNFSLQKKAS